MIALAAAVVILTELVRLCGTIYTEMMQLLHTYEVPEMVIQPLFKCAAISIIAKTTAELCKESGEQALGFKVELAGTLACLVASMPLLLHVISFISGLLMVTI